MNLGAQPGFDMVSDDEGSQTSVRNIEAPPPNRDSTMRTLVRQSQRQTIASQIEEEVAELEKNNRCPAIILCILVLVLLIMALGMVAVFFVKSNSNEQLVVYIDNG